MNMISLSENELKKTKIVHINWNWNAASDELSKWRFAPYTCKISDADAHKSIYFSGSLFANFGYSKTDGKIPISMQREKKNQKQNTCGKVAEHKKIICGLSTLFKCVGKWSQNQKIEMRNIVWFID